MSATPQYCYLGFFVLTLPVLVAASRCAEISASLNTKTPLVAKCRELTREVQCLTAIQAPFQFADASEYCRCLGEDVQLLNRLDSSFKDFFFALYPNEEFWLNVQLKVLEKFTDVRGHIYPNQEHLVQNNPNIDHCVAVWPGREATTGDLVRQAHPCFHSRKYFVCRKDGAACNDITDENRAICITFYTVSRVTWYAARGECLQNGGDLVYLRENETYSSVLGSKKMAEQVWVGLRRALWQWHNGTEVLSANWSLYQLPAAANATCVTVTTARGEWHTQKCNDSFNLLCTESKPVASGGGGSKKEKGKLTLNYYIIGGILGGILVLLIIVLCCVWMCKCRKVEEKPLNRLRYMTMPAQDVFHNPDITAVPGHPNAVIPGNVLRKVPSATKLQISADVQRDRFGNAQPHSGGISGNRRPLERSLSSTTRQNTYVPQTMRSVSMEDISVRWGSWGEPTPPITVSQGNIPQGTPLFTRKESNQLRNSRNRNNSPNNKDRQLRNSKNKINRMNSKNAKNDHKNRSRNPPVTPILPSQRGEIILGVQDGQIIIQNKAKSKSKNKRKKKNNPTYVNEVPVPPTRRPTRDTQRHLSDVEVIDDHPSDYNSSDRFRY